MTLQKRKHPRLKTFDYATPGAYFITICAYKRRALFGSIRPGNKPEDISCRLSVYGQCIRELIQQLETKYPQAQIDHMVVMPNHIHLLITLKEASDADIPTMIGRFKSCATRACWKLGYPEKQLFQTSFHDHVVRSETEYQNIWEYIDTNPLKWALDRYYIPEQ
ncbi:MAG: transposase [Oscillospiraceae bacterium]|nr:transposase [Oscillospiraceae bacterium]